MTNVKDDQGLAPPKQGDVFRCNGCGMELKLTRDCGCKEPNHVHFHCCGQEIAKVREVSHEPRR